MPFTVIPVVVTDVQDVIASGQVRPTDQLVDVQTFASPARSPPIMEPLFEGGLDRLPQGSRLHRQRLHLEPRRAARTRRSATLHAFVLHAIDATGLVHAMILRMQALLLPVRTLVLSGGH